eukprot:TRINITY_DN18406_c1_g1_i1.p1 TRINITY_DN18406_c1_g1~~TRINITY_DN18406_c1_g1_i1.p1  ORF type:complete len:113 (+),score=15.33 TRINITY_DN18406_c1_g1_i1:167-505(+)
MLFHLQCSSCVTLNPCFTVALKSWIYMCSSRHPNITTASRNCRDGLERKKEDNPEASGDLEEQDAGSLDKTFGNIYMYNNKKKKKRKEKTTYPFGNTVQTMNWRANNGNPEQ